MPGLTAHHETILKALHKVFLLDQPFPLVFTKLQMGKAKNRWKWNKCCLFSFLKPPGICFLGFLFITQFFAILKVIKQY